MVFHQIRVKNPLFQVWVYSSTYEFEFMGLNRLSTFRTPSNQSVLEAVLEIENFPNRNVHKNNTTYVIFFVKMEYTVTKGDLFLCFVHKPICHLVSVVITKKARSVIKYIYGPELLNFNFKRPERTQTGLELGAGEWNVCPGPSHLYNYV